MARGRALHFGSGRGWTTRLPALSTEIFEVVRDLTVNGVLVRSLLPGPLRSLALRALGMPIGRSRISAGCFFGSRMVWIGDGSFVGREVFFDSSSAVRIGAHVKIGPRCMFITSTHRLSGAAGRAGSGTSRPIVVADGSWIGANALVLPGVTIGEGVVVGAGAVVTRDCEPNGLYLGSPARRVRELG